MSPWTVVLWQTDTLLQEGHCSLSVPIWFLLTGWKLSPLNKQECKVEMAKWEFLLFFCIFSKKCRICWTFVTAISFISPTQISSLAMPAVARIWSREWWSRVELPIQINVKWSQNVPFCGLWWRENGVFEVKYGTFSMCRMRPKNVEMMRFLLIWVQFWGCFLGESKGKSLDEYLTYCSCQIIDITQLIDIQLNKSTIFSRTMADGRWQFIWGQGTMVEKMVKKLLIYIYIY